MRFAVDIILRFEIEADSFEAAEMAVCQPGVDWNKGYLIDLGAAAEEPL